MKYYSWFYEADWWVGKILIIRLEKVAPKANYETVKKETTPHINSNSKKRPLMPENRKKSLYEIKRWPYFFNHKWPNSTSNNLPKITYISIYEKL